MKKRFDDIFGATRYTKALQNIRELQREWNKATQSRRSEADLSQAPGVGRGEGPWRRPLVECKRRVGTEDASPEALSRSPYVTARVARDAG